MRDPESVVDLPDPVIRDPIQCESSENIPLEGTISPGSCVEAAKFCHTQSRESPMQNLGEKETQGDRWNGNSSSQDGNEEIVTVSQLRPSRLYKFDVFVHCTR